MIKQFYLTHIVDMGAITMNGFSAFPKASALLDPQHHIVYRHIQDTHSGCLSSLQRWSRCIQQPELTRPQDTRWGGFLTPLQRCSRCILQPQPTAPQDTRWKRVTYPLVEMQSVYSTASVDSAKKHIS